MDEEERKNKRTEPEDGTEWVGSIRIQKTRVNKNDSESQNQQASNDIRSSIPQKTYRQRFWRFLDKRAIILITFIYTVFAGLQWRAMRESNRTNREALISVQRA